MTFIRTDKDGGGGMKQQRTTETEGKKVSERFRLFISNRGRKKINIVIEQGYETSIKAKL